jgi:tetratricopeptide (TPR) repeat protein
MKMWDSANICFNIADVKGLDESALNFYHANALLAAGDANKAIQYFDSVINGDDDRFKVPARWYLSLAYLQIGQVEKSKELLTELQAITDIYSKKAKDLLEQLK